MKIKWVYFEHVQSGMCAMQSEGRSRKFTVLFFGNGLADRVQSWYVARDTHQPTLEENQEAGVVACVHVHTPSSKFEEFWFYNSGNDWTDRVEIWHGYRDPPAQ